MNSRSIKLGISLNGPVFYSVMLFISLFMLIYPEHYVFMPVSTIWIIHLLGFCVFLLYYIKLPRCSSIHKLYIYSFIILITGLLSSYIYNTGGDLGIAKRGLQIILFVFDAYWIIFLLRKTEKNICFYDLLKWLVYIAILQAIISFIFFFYPSFYAWYSSFVITRFDNDEIQILNSFRLMSVGDMRYATASVHYGFMMWAAILLRKVKYSFIGKYTITFSFIVTLFIIAGLLSGRTFFVFLIVTMPFLFNLYDRKFFVSFRQSVKIFTPVLISALLAFIYLLSENEEMISWLFELFINFSEEGSIESSSTNDLKSMYIFPDNILTWLVGDGKTINSEGGFYMSVDVGYIRSIYYWGVLGSLIYFIVQLKLYGLITRLSNDSNIKCFCRFVVIWLFVYFLKDMYSIEKLMVLFIVTLTYTKLLTNTYLGQKV